MDKLIEIILSSVNDKNYNKLIQIALSIFVLFAPSFSYIFLYNRELFCELDFLKLLFLCVNLNILIFIVFYCYSLNSYILESDKKYRQIKKIEVDIENLKSSISDFIDTLPSDQKAADSSQIENVHSEIEDCEKIISDIKARKKHKEKILFPETVFNLCLFIFIIHFSYFIFFIIQNHTIIISKYLLFITFLSMLFSSSLLKLTRYINEFKTNIVNLLTYAGICAISVYYFYNLILRLISLLNNH